MSDRSHGRSNFALLLKQFRAARSLTQEELAERAGLGVTTVSELERRVSKQPRIATVRLLADALELSPDDRAALQQAAIGSSPPIPQTELHTFLIADIRGYTRYTEEHGDEAAARLASHFLSIVEMEVEERGGTLLEARGDEALVVFSSVRQALRAAVELQACFGRASDEGLPLAVGIGLDAGEAVPVDGGYRGAALNLAARLCSLAAAGEVLASDTLVNLAHHVDGLAYTDRGLTQLKGFVEPVKVIRIAPAHDLSAVGQELMMDGESSAQQQIRQDLPTGGFLGSLPAGPLIAREHEVHGALQAIQAVTDGEGRLVLLTGEPGVGKTRLAQEVTVQLLQQNFLVAAGRCYEPEQSVPYYPFLEALARLYTLAPVPLHRDALRRWPYLAQLLPEELEGALRTPASVGTVEEQHHVFRAVTGFLQSLAQTAPVALLLDDLHWADSTSLRLLTHLARQTRSHRLLLLGTHRDTDAESRKRLQDVARDLDREGLLERVSLRSLGPEETATLVGVALGTWVSDEFAELMYRRTEGNPFFVRQVLRDLVERGDLYRHEGDWARRAIEDIQVPESVRLVIEQRLARLSEGAQEILSEASVLGQVFSLRELEAMSAGNPHRLEAVEDALDEATEAGLVREQTGDRYGFDHALTQQTLYEGLLARRRRRLHLATGEALERMAAKGRTADIAWHFLQAGDAERALHYALRAGDEAAKIFAHSEAEQQYRTALRLARESEERGLGVEALEKLGGVLKTVGQYDEALAMLEEAARYYAAEGDREGERRTVAQIGHAHQRRGSFAEGIARLEPALARLSAPPLSEGIAALYVELAFLYFRGGGYREQLEVAERGAEAARAAGSDRLLAQAELVRGYALSCTGHPAEFRQVMEGVVKLSQHVGDLATESEALRALVSSYADAAELAQATTCAQRALEIEQRLGDASRIAFAAYVRGLVAYWSGEWDTAQAAFQRSLELYQEIGAEEHTMIPMFGLGAVYMGRGDRALGRHYLEQHLAIARRTGDLIWMCSAEALLAEQELLDGQIDTARQRLEEGLDLPGLPEVDMAIARATLAWVYLELGNAERAAQLADNAVKVAADQANRRVSVEALRVQGMIMSRQGHWEESRRHFDSAVALTGETTYPFARARVMHEYGLMFDRLGDSRQAHNRLTEALNIFRRIGAQKEGERTQRALSLVAQR